MVFISCASEPDRIAMLFLSSLGDRTNKFAIMIFSRPISLKRIAIHRYLYFMPVKFIYIFPLPPTSALFLLFTKMWESSVFPKTKTKLPHNEDLKLMCLRLNVSNFLLRCAHTSLLPPHWHSLKLSSPLQLFYETRFSVCHQTFPFSYYFYFVLTDCLMQWCSLGTISLQSQLLCW